MVCNAHFYWSVGYTVNGVFSTLLELASVLCTLKMVCVLRPGSHTLFGVMCTLIIMSAYYLGSCFGCFIIFVLINNFNSRTIFVAVWCLSGAVDPVLFHYMWAWGRWGEG